MSSTFNKQIFNAFKPAYDELMKSIENDLYTNSMSNTSCMAPFWCMCPSCMYNASISQDPELPVGMGGLSDWSLPVLEKEESKCECGSDAYYRSQGTVGPHSDYCPKSNKKGE